MENRWVRSVSEAMLLRARVVVPVTRPPIEDGAVLAAGGRIRAVGRWRDLMAQVTPGAHRRDLGEVAVLPGLINSHAHLDYTDMSGQLVPPHSFTDWIKCMTELKGGWCYSDFADSWRNGARMLLRTGTTAVADIEAVPDLLPEAWQSTPLRVFSFLEMTGVRSRRQPKVILGEALAKVDSLSSVRCRASLSPHAPYSTTPELMRLSAQAARERGWRIAAHVAESAEEFDMFKHARGPMFDWLARNERPMNDCGAVSPVGYLLRQQLLGDNLLAVHANYLDSGDAALLAQHGVHVVHCPRSHAFFDHQPFPYAELRAAGINVCLGTDSLATVRKRRGEPVELDVFAEMAAFAKAFPCVPARDILRMATVNGARALGLDRRAGRLAPGSFADLIAIPFGEAPEVVCEGILSHSGPITASLIGGEWAHFSD